MLLHIYCISFLCYCIFTVLLLTLLHMLLMYFGHFAIKVWTVGQILTDQDCNLQTDADSEIESRHEISTAFEEQHSKNLRNAVWPAIRS